MRALAARLSPLAERGDWVTVVFDGREPGEPVAAPGVEVLFAPGGPNSADDRIVELVEADENPTDLTVVSSDSDLARRVGELGAEVLGAGEFRNRI